MAKISLDLDALKAERASLGDFLARPDAYGSPDFTVKNKRFSELETLIAKGEERAALEQNLRDAKELANDGGELAELAKAEITETEARLAELEEELFILLTPKDPNDEKNIIIEIRAGAGGACDSDPKSHGHRRPGVSALIRGDFRYAACGQADAGALPVRL